MVSKITVKLKRRVAADMRIYSRMYKAIITPLNITNYVVRPASADRVITVYRTDKIKDKLTLIAFSLQVYAIRLI
jgi:hypothetical protein